MQLSSIISTSKTIKAEHPYLNGFVVELEYISREKMKKLVSKATTTSFDKKTRQPKESLDDKLFLELYTKAAVRGWTGLTLESISQLLPIDVPAGTDMTQEIEYSDANALELVNNSPEFEQWIATTLGTVENFNKVKD